MSLAVIHSRALHALDAPEVTVEVHLVNGLPGFTLVGLADVEVKEARERVRAALQNSGLDFPANKRITVNLAPADLPKVLTKTIIKNFRRSVGTISRSARTFYGRCVRGEDAPPLCSQTGASYLQL